MKYTDGRTPQLGDQITIASKHSGTVVANLSLKTYSEHYAEQSWDYLSDGILVETSFAGLVHYTEESLLTENIILIARKQE
ncbi:hypothetical protein [Thaumasiovibrio subtropicus]|uniref:hypothetical protein n=1 Tax=Thaumasiovibrio subtropicus TaxID=1891207 RepID=UPI000B354C26|nr:hypothetical protein [Thaumasiovibrio subtropicus]